MRHSQRALKVPSGDRTSRPEATHLHTPDLGPFFFGTLSCKTLLVPTRLPPRRPTVEVCPHVLKTVVRLCLVDRGTANCHFVDFGPGTSLAERPSATEVKVSGFPHHRRWWTAARHLLAFQARPLRHSVALREPSCQTPRALCGAEHAVGRAFRRLSQQ